MKNVLTQAQQPQPQEPAQGTDQAAKVSHLTLVVSELAQGRDILEIPTREGGLLLQDDEGDLLELITEITVDVVPNYYKNNWVRFLMDYTQVLANATSDGTGDVIADVRYWVDTIYSDGRKMVA